MVVVMATLPRVDSQSLLSIEGSSTMGDIIDLPHWGLLDGERNAR